MSTLKVSKRLLQVLIVAKCIVNVVILVAKGLLRLVLIVAKCIVNEELAEYDRIMKLVLIVAKCIVNFFVYFSCTF